MVDYVWRDGARLTPYMAYRIDRIKGKFRVRTSYNVLVSSGIRLRSEQESIFRARYKPASQLGGVRVYDWQWWNGVLWGRWSSAGRVAVPNSPLANHVLENSGRGAVDLRDDGPDPGVLTRGTFRDRVLREILAEEEFDNEGDNFGENWHKRFLGNPYAAVPGQGAGGGGVVINPNPPTATSKSEDDEMLMLIVKVGAKNHLVALGQGSLRHFLPSDPYQKIKNLARTNDDWQEVEQKEFPALVRTYGVDLNAYRIVSGGGFQVLDPLTNKYGGGNLWSTENVIRANQVLILSRLPKK